MAIWQHGMLHHCLADPILCPLQSLGASAQWELLMRWLLQAPKSPVVDMAVDASGGLLATGSADGSARVWDTDGFFCTHAFHGHRYVLHRGMAACTHKIMLEFQVFTLQRREKKPCIT